MVFPGFWEVNASSFLPVNILTREDLPTLLLPIKAYSKRPSFGHFLTSVLLITKFALLIIISFCFYIPWAKVRKRAGKGKYPVPDNKKRGYTIRCTPVPTEIPIFLFDETECLAAVLSLHQKNVCPACQPAQFYPGSLNTFAGCRQLRQSQHVDDTEAYLPFRRET